MGSLSEVVRFVDIKQPRGKCSFESMYFGNGCNFGVFVSVYVYSMYACFSDAICEM